MQTIQVLSASEISTEDADSAIEQNTGRASILPGGMRGPALNPATDVKREASVVDRHDSQPSSQAQAL
jgi:hypothetical protein